MFDAASQQNLARVADAQRKFAERQRELIGRIDTRLSDQELDSLVQAILENQAAFERSLGGDSPAAN